MLGAAGLLDAEVDFRVVNCTRQIGVGKRGRKAVAKICGENKWGTPMFFFLGFQ